MLKVFIVDDEAPARDELRFLLKNVADVEIVGEADSGVSALEQVKLIQPDVVFLDIEMRGMDGMETAACIRQIAPQSLVVFATAYDEYALRAFEVGAVDYILKPFEPERITLALQRIQHAKMNSWSQTVAKIDHIVRNRVHLKKIPVESRGKIYMLDFDKILYAHASSGCVEVVTAGQTYMYSGTLTDLEERLKDSIFMRVHKSYIVNLDKICEVIPWFKGTYWLTVHGSVTELPVSKAQIKELKAILGLDKGASS